MSKIAIVGVEGSGKTVLMTVLGEKFQTPDPYGLFLSPETRETLDFHRVNLGKLANGEWPIETPHDSVRSLRWTLQRKDANDENAVMSDLNFLDFAGEIYREAFGGDVDAKDRHWAEECEILRNYVRAADALIVLVNLRNVVLRMADPRTNQVVWLSKGIVDYAKRDLKIANVALAFTQTDAYRDVIESAGGDLKSVLKKYLPDVFNVYSKLPLFALSAVDKTVLGDDGLPRPAPGFGSRGLDDLVHWILGCNEAGKAYADEIEKIKARPHVLWQEIVAGMDALRTDAAQPTGLSTAERLEKVGALQAAAGELSVNALRHTVPDFTDESLVERQAELESWAKLAGLVNEYVKAVEAKRGGFAAQLEASLAAEGMSQPILLARVREEARQIRAAQKRKAVTRGLVAAGLVAVAVVVGVVAAGSHNAEVDRLVAEKGYSCTSFLGVKTAVWKAGVKHPKNEFLRTTETEDECKSTRPGYVWVRGTATDKWTPGLVHPDNSDLVADVTLETWKSVKPGYRWRRGTCEIEWSAGSVHPDNSDLVADATPETWKSIKPGYRWKRGTTEIEWDVGGAHPTCSDLIAADKPRTWVCTKKGYMWDGKNSIVAGYDKVVSSVKGIKLRFAIENGSASVIEPVGPKDDVFGVVDIPEKVDGLPVIGIKMDAFSFCRKLTKVKIPSSVTNIDDYAFWGCENLTSIMVAKGNVSFCDVDGVLYSQDKTVLVCFPSGQTSVRILPDVTSIGNGAFRDCRWLRSVTIPSGVTSIGKWAFDGCRALTSVTIPSSVTSIDYCAFDSCNELGAGVVIVDDCVLTVNEPRPSNVTIPDGVRLIAGGAFNSCRDLTSVTISSGVTSIGKGAFCGCRNLKIFYVNRANPAFCSLDGMLCSKDGKKLIAGINGEVTIPSSVTSIDAMAFAHCYKLTAVTIPPSVTSIGDGAFEECSTLTSVTIPPSVTSIGDGAFAGCRALTSITIPEGVTSIGRKAFWGCDNLTLVTIPSSVVIIGEHAFCFCDKIGPFCVDPANNAYSSIGGLLCSKDGKTLLSGRSGDVMIPSSVTSIGDMAFCSCDGLTSVTIPPSVTRIGDEAFQFCFGLTSVTIPPSVMSIGDEAFYCCNRLTSVMIPASVTSIGARLFMDCDKLRTVYSDDPEWAKKQMSRSGVDIEKVKFVRQRQGKGL